MKCQENYLFYVSGMYQVLNDTVTSFRQTENNYKAKLKTALLQYFSKLQSAFITECITNI